MPDLIPVEHDPWNDPPTTLVPVDFDPFDPRMFGASATAKPGQTVPPSAIQPSGNYPAVSSAVQSIGQSVAEPAAQLGRVLTGNSDNPWGDIGLAALGLAAPEAKLAGPATKAAEEAAPTIAKAIRAYHGSPHDFDAFDMSKIGTGEGAQSYGHGLYFAEAEGTAKSYRDALAARNQPTSLTDSMGTLEIGGKPFRQTHDVDNMPEWAQFAATGDQEGAANLAKDRLARWQELAADKTYPFPDYAVDKVKAYNGLIGDLSSGKPLTTPKPPQGRMYEVNINADPEHFLDWDKPLSEQHPTVQQKLNDAWLAHPIDHAHQTGEDIYRQAEIDLHQPGQGHLDKVVAAQKLNEAGIPGIKYLDQGSRALPDPNLPKYQAKVAKWQQEVARDPSESNQSRLSDAQQELESAQRAGKERTSNYVVFNDKLIDIARKYGLAGLIAGGASHFSTTPVNHDPFQQ